MWDDPAQEQELLNRLKQRIKPPNDPEPLEVWKLVVFAVLTVILLFAADTCNRAVYPL